MNLRKLKLNKAFESVVSHQNLERIYIYICNKLNDKNPEAKKTYSQKEFSYILKSKTRLKFYENVWIGSRNVDIFIPGIKIAESDCIYKGVVFEVDGGIHNSELKIKKDLSLYDQLFNLGLFVKGILNEDFNEITVQSDLYHLLNGSRTSSRERRRIWRSIYIYTIFKNMDRDDIRACFGIKGLYYIEMLGDIYGK